MRFDTEVCFVKEYSGAYNTETGDYEEGVARKEYNLANVTDASETTMQLVYGKIKQGALVIRIQGERPEPFDYIKIGDRKYRADSTRELRRLSTFVVSEVPRCQR